MRRIGLLAIASIGLALLIGQVINRFYAHDAFASEEARQSLEVTEAQTAELNASRIMSDMIAFGLIGGLLGALAGSNTVPCATFRRRVVGGIGGLAIGTAFGIAAGYVGGMHDARVPFPTDPMLYWIGRWTLIFGLLGLGAGIAAAIAAEKRLRMDAVVGGAIGAGTATVMYCLLSGSITPNESHENVIPGHSGNRLLMLVSGYTLITLAIALQLLSARKKSDGSAGDTDASEAETAVN